MHAEPYSQATCEQLMAEKAARLQELLKRKPGQQHYKLSLEAFLQADQRAQRFLLHRLEDSVRAVRPPAS